MCQEMPGWLWGWWELLHNFPINSLTIIRSFECNVCWIGVQKNLGWGHRVGVVYATVAVVYTPCGHKNYKDVVALSGTAGMSSAAFKDLWLSLAMGIMQHVPPVLAVAWAHKHLAWEKKVIGNCFIYLGPSSVEAYKQLLCPAVTGAHTQLYTQSYSDKGPQH